MDNNCRHYYNLKNSQVCDIQVAKLIWKIENTIIKAKYFSKSPIIGVRIKRNANRNQSVGLAFINPNTQYRTNISFQMPCSKYHKTTYKITEHI